MSKKHIGPFLSIGLAILIIGQPAYVSVAFPQGPPQQITFDAPSAVRVGTATVKLSATSDSKLPVGFYVREGPAEVNGDTLKLTTLPPRAKFPVKVTVVAWQFGRATDPKIQSAEPVERTFFTPQTSSSRQRLGPARS